MSSVTDIKESIKKLTVIELADLVKDLEEEFGVTAAAPVIAVAPDAAGGSAEAVPAEEKTEFNVVLTAYGEKKIQVIKVVRSLTGLGLKEAKDMVDSAPSTIKEDATKDEAGKMKSAIEEVGGTVELT